MEMKDCFKVHATMVSNEFIDGYMASANGEYLKEYLYLLRHQDRDVTVTMIADALNHTEADVNRAIAYWKRAGVLSEEPAGKGGDQAAPDTAGAQASADGKRLGAASTGKPDMPSAMRRNPSSAVRPESLSDGTLRPEAGPKSARAAELPEAGSKPAREAAFPEAGPKPAPAAACPETGTAAGQAGSEPAANRPVYSPEAVSRLAGDEDFAQLLYIAQKYMNKVFTQRECEVFAYLYDGLSMPAELLEYAVEHCVQGGHTSIRYIETVALSWHEKGLGTVEEAKAYAGSYNRDAFAVMKAFGLGGRKPGNTEQDMIDKWFKEYGFTREIVLEALNRTMDAIHAPSFKYADKILSGWRDSGVHTVSDIKRLDDEFAGRAKPAGTPAPGTKPANGRGKGSPNQFQNFPQRDIDYDALVLKQLSQQ